MYQAIQQQQQQQKKILILWEFDRIKLLNVLQTLL